MSFELTQVQFDAYASLTGMHRSPTALALRLVLVEGIRPVDAAALAGVSDGVLRKRLVVVRKKLALARVVAGVTETRGVVTNGGKVPEGR